jgi:hypothetical protein
MDEPVHPPPMLAKHCLGRLFHAGLLPTAICKNMKLRRTAKLALTELYVS